MPKSILWDRVLTRSGLELKRNVKSFVPIAPLGGSSNAVKARVDNTTFKREKKNQNPSSSCRMITSKNLYYIIILFYFTRNNLSIKKKTKKQKQHYNARDKKSTVKPRQLYMYELPQAKENR